LSGVIQQHQSIKVNFLAGTGLRDLRASRLAGVKSFAWIDCTCRDLSDRNRRRIMRSREPVAP
jgi:hypothetical protein